MIGQQRRYSIAFLVCLLLATTVCGGEKAANAAPPAGAAGGSGAGADSDLTPFQMENGVGPLTEAITVGPVDHELAEKGEKIFAEKCSACHKMEEKYVGPALGGVTARRTPTYVMNMIMAPDVMYTRHPVARQLLAETMTPMPNLGLTQEQARTVLEYLRAEGASQAQHHEGE